MAFCHSVIDIGTLHVVYFIAIHYHARSIKLKQCKCLDFYNIEKASRTAILLLLLRRRSWRLSSGRLSSRELELECDEGVSFSISGLRRRVRELRVVVLGEPTPRLEWYHTVQSAGVDAVVRLAQYDVGKRLWMEEK